MGDKDNQHQSYTVDTPDMDWANEWDDEVDIDVSTPDYWDDDDIDVDVPAPVAAADMDIDIDVPTLPAVEDVADTAPATEDVQAIEADAPAVDETIDVAPVALQAEDTTPVVADTAPIEDEVVAIAPVEEAGATRPDADDITDAVPAVDAIEAIAPVEGEIVDTAPTADQPAPDTETEAQPAPVADTPVAEADKDANATNSEDVDTAIPDQPAATDVVKTAEQLAQEEELLEQYRNQMGDTHAELADVSEYKNFRKQTKSAGPDRSKNKTSDFDIFANRYKAKTLNAAVAATDPIVYFYNACLRANGTVMLFNVYQVLQDRFVGKLIPQLFTSVAEASSKIEELNLANLLAQLPVCQEFPQYDFVISVSARFFTKPAILEKLLRNVPDPAPANLVMAFDCVSLQNIGVAAKTGLGALKERGIKVLLDNTERVSMTSLTDLDYDYIRVDSRYYEMGNPRAESFLRLILDMAKEQGVGTVATYCDNEDMAEYMLFMGVDAVQGNACSRPMRTVPNAVKAVTLLQSMLES